MSVAFGTIVGFDESPVQCQPESGARNLYTGLGALAHGVEQQAEKRIQLAPGSFAGRAHHGKLPLGCAVQAFVDQCSHLGFICPVQAEQDAASGDFPYDFCDGLVVMPKSDHFSGVVVMLLKYGTAFLTLALLSLMRVLRRSHCSSIFSGLVACVLALFFPVQGHAQAPLLGSLPPVVRVELERGNIPLNAVAVWVQPVDARQPTLAFNAGRPMNPASVMKVVTTYAALELLGPEKTWTTRIMTGEAYHDPGIPIGNLYLVGDGDPVLTYERLWRLMRRFRSLGYSIIGGDIVLDHSALVLPEHDPYAFDGRGLRPYNSGGSGLLIHFNTQELALFPTSQPGGPVKVVAEPPLSGLEIDNQLVSSSSSCDVWYRDLEAETIKGSPKDGKRRMVLTGSLPISCGPRVLGTSPFVPSDYGVAMVKSLWWELGGTVRGKVRNGVTPADANLLIYDESVPLGEIVRTMNKWSSNVIARQLLAQVGRASLGSAAGGNTSTDMVAAGAEAARRSMIQAGIDVSGLEIDNGSGLSRNARIRADSLGALLISAWQRPWMPDFIASLPVAGRDGTARRRLDGSPASGYAHLKTGSINDVRSIAGYVHDRNGRRHAVVMMVNHPEAGNSRKAQDALIEWVWSGMAEAEEPPALPRDMSPSRHTPARGRR